jgi:hypothetical protein
MKRVFARITNRISSHINRDPNIFPFSLRRDVVIALVCIAAIFLELIGKSGFLHVVAACGIVVGIFGARMLYWETVATNEELKSVGNQIAGAGISTTLSSSERTQVAALFTFGLVIFFLFLFAFPITKYHELHTAALFTGGLFLWCFFPPVGMYLLIKLIRRRCNRWLKSFAASEDDARKVEIKRILRATGFISLLVSGIMQLPAALV